MQQHAQAVLHYFLLTLYRLGLVPVLEDHGSQVQVGQHIPQPCRDKLPHFQFAAKRGHRGIRAQTKGCAEAGHGLRVLATGTVKRHICPSKTKSLGEGAGGIAENQPGVAEERIVKRVDIIVVLGRQLLEHIRMAANGALAEDHQAAGHDVGTLNSDRDSGTAVAYAQVVTRAKRDGLATVNVHGIGQYTALELGKVVFKDGRRHCRLLTFINHIGSVVYSCLRDIGLGGDSGQRLLHTLHISNRRIELTADTGETTSGANGRRSRTGRTGGQGDAATHRQALNQHTPALTGHIHATDDVVQRNEDIFTLDRAIQERAANRAMTTADLHAFGVPGDQCAGNTIVFGFAQEPVRIEHAEGKANNRGDGRQGDPALLEIQPDTDNFLAIDFLFANDTGVRKRRRI